MKSDRAKRVLGVLMAHGDAIFAIGSLLFLVGVVIGFHLLSVETEAPISASRGMFFQMSRLALAFSLLGMSVMITGALLFAEETDKINRAREERRSGKVSVDGHLSASHLWRHNAEKTERRRQERAAMRARERMGLPVRSRYQLF